LINLQSEIVQALEANQALLILLNGPRIYHLRAPKEEEFPRITFFELTNLDYPYADDQVITSEIHIQLDIWHKLPPSQIAKEVDKTMKRLSFRRTSTADLFEDEIQIYHYAMRYQTNYVIEEEAFGDSDRSKRFTCRSSNQG
jgi:hypothetical protein